MDNVEMVRKNLAYLSKHGDLYDTIALKKGFQTRKKTFFKANILLFSRLLYLGVLLEEKIVRHFSPIKKTKNVQDEIRNILGVNIDIVRRRTCTDLMNSSSFMQLMKKCRYCLWNGEKDLSILYQREAVSKEEYIQHLKKISQFCELYSIEEVLLNKKEIEQLFSDINLENYNETKLREILDIIIYGTSMSKQLDEQFLSLRSKELPIFIQELEKAKMDCSWILKLGEQIKDIPVQNALREFMERGNLDQLKQTVLLRLSLHLNSEGCYKDKVYGKVFEDIAIKDEYIKVLAHNEEGNLHDIRVMRLYDYLEVKNYDALIEKVAHSFDDKEILYLSLLHLYLCNPKQENAIKQVAGKSLFDELYDSFEEEKKESFYKKLLPCAKKSRRLINGCMILFSIFITLGFCGVLWIGGLSFDYIQTCFLGEKGTISGEKICLAIVDTYDKSSSFEKNLVKSIMGTLKEIEFDFSNPLSASTGDVSTKGIGKEEVIGYCHSVNAQKQVPFYYATGYADSATYQGGKLDYHIVQPSISFSEFQEVEEAFSVEDYMMNRKDLKKAISNHELHLVKNLYPVDDHYVMSSIHIIDRKDASKEFSIDYERAYEMGGTITLEEEKLLLSMRQPAIICTYGINPKYNHFYGEDLERKSYTSLPQSQIKEAIIRGLGLKQDASLEAILNAIKGKNYSKTPIRDAGLSYKIKRLDEEEYMETIASMDSLVCNLAASLAVEVDEELTYVIGYKIEADGFIKKENGHAWAMKENGEIIEVTPSISLEEEKNELQELINNVMDFGVQNNIPICVILFLIGATVNKLYGKKIRVTLKEKQVKQVLETEGIEEAYAKINEVLYGGINLPRKRNMVDFIETIEREFASFDSHDLKELKEKLQMGIEEKEVKDKAIKLVHEIPYIKEHAEELQKQLIYKKR